MPKTPELTRQDLTFRASQRLTDHDDGGGMMTNRALTGKENELFDPISDVDRTMGALDARLVYAAVLRDDDAGLLGANVILSQPPAQKNVSALLMVADYYGQERANMMQRLEAYRVPTTESRMTLLGTQLKGSRSVQAYQALTAALPVVGQVLALRYLVKNAPAYEFVRIARLASSVETFEDDKGEFQRRVIKITTQQPLERDHIGVADANRYKAQPPVLLLNTQIADSAKYYGIKPLAKAIAKGDSSLKLDSIYTKLVPTATVETAHADDWAAGKPMWIETAPERVLLRGINAAGDVYLPCPVLPGSLKLDGWTDDAQGSLKKGDVALQADYATGAIRGLSGYFDSISAIPAVQIRNYAYSAVLNVDDTNVGTEWVLRLFPKPARGSVEIAFLSGGQWYELQDKGDFVLRDEAGKERGRISPNGSATVTLPALPDSGSKIIATWTPRDFYRTLGGGEAGAAIAPLPKPAELVLPAVGLGAIAKGSLKISWAGGSAQDNGAGQLTGGLAGSVNYAAGTFSPAGAVSGSLKIIAKQYTSTPVKKQVAVAGGGSALSLVVGAFVAGTLQLEIVVGRRDKYGRNIYWYKYKSLKKQVSNISSSQTAMVLGDNGAGQLTWNGKVLNGSSVNYQTGEIRATLEAFKGAVIEPEHSEAALDAQESADDEYLKRRKFTEASVVAPATATVSLITSPDTRDIVQTVDTGINQFDVLRDLAWPRAAIADSWRFDINGVETIERGGVLYQDWNNKTGAGKEIGSLNLATGMVSLNHLAPDAAVSVKVLQGVYTQGEYQIKHYHGRTAAAPIRPQSFEAWAETAGGTELSGRAGADERITGTLTGAIEYVTGYFALTAGEPIPPDSLRYNAVSESSIPLDSTVIGINATRLPADGKVPMVRAGDMIVISNHHTQDIGSAHTAGQTVSLERQNLDRLCVVDANGEHVSAEQYDYDLEAGSLKWATPLDLAKYAMPLSTVQIWEEENRVMNADISGSLKLQFGVSRDYPLENTYVSSAIIGGNMQVRVTEPFSQRAWTNVWQDTRIDEPILAKLNTADYPFKLTSDGAITERWLMKFKNTTQFELYGERLGLVAEGDIYNDLAPVNPATKKPYFTLPALAMGGGFATQNCVRFNTYGTPLPVWIVRSVQPSSERQSAADGFRLCLRGNTAVTKATP